MSTKAQEIKQAVQERYGAIADHQQDIANETPVELYNSRPQAESCCSSDCCSADTAKGSINNTGLAEALYNQEEVNSLPESVTNISLGCGSPTAIASLKPGETVLDLGSGGGIDCFIAAKAVGPEGRVIGVDMTDSMLALANKNKAKLGFENVEFRKGDIEDLPIGNDEIDTIISNCVINLAPDKEAVFREAFRVLKPGGRFMVSDVVTNGEFPQAIQDRINAWVGCISGALDEGVYLDKLRHVGFEKIEVASKTSYGVENMDILDDSVREALTKDVDWSNVPPNARVHSANIVAYKPL